MRKAMRTGVDSAPVAPWAWATGIFQRDPVELVSYAIPSDGFDGDPLDDPMATVMVRTAVGDPGTLAEVRLSSIACLDPRDHEWWARPRYYYSSTAFVFEDEMVY